ncbi:flagellar protein FliT [Halomonas sp. ML-15]|nr:flagellar protein FliT [Halomonas sp. ML-15]
MLKLARDEAWGELIELQSRYVIEVERLSRMEQELVLDAPHRQRKAALLEAILERDREVRERLVARRDELGALIGTSQRRRDLSRAYRTASGTNVVDAEYVFVGNRETPGAS